MKTLLQYTCVLMALYMLNISIDAPDATHLPMRENLAHNEQESIVELLIEKGLGYTDAIAEYDDSDTENESGGKKHFALDFYVLPAAIAIPVVHLYTHRQPATGIYRPVRHSTEIHSPPPEA